MAIKKTDFVIKTGCFLIILMLLFSHISFVRALEYELKYDENGNLIQDADYNYEYNSLNQLIKIRNKTGSTIEEYLYGYDGSRVKKINYPHSEITYYIDENFIRVINSSGTSDIEYYYDNGQLVAKVENGNKFFYHPDNLGSTNMVTDSLGNVVERIEYEPYGTVKQGGDNRFLFTGKELDDTDLMYYGARYYSPFLTRFIQPDTIIQDIYDPQNLNRYSYARNNPLTYVDDTGHFWHAVAGAVIGAVVGAISYTVSTIISGSEFNTGGFIGATIGGAVAGAVGAATFGATFIALGPTSVGGSVLAGVGAGTVSGIASYETGTLASNLVTGNKWSSGLLDPKGVAFSGVTGGVIGGVVGGIIGASAVRGAIGGSSGSVQKVPISKIYGHATDNPAHIFREGARTSQEVPVQLIKVGDNYMISNGVGRSIRDLASGKKYVNAQIIQDYSSADKLTGVDKHWWNNLVTKIDDPARWVNWPEKFKNLMEGVK